MKPITYLLDTNAVIDILREKPLTLQRMNETMESGNHLALCSVVYYEVIRGLRISKASKQMENFKRFQMGPIRNLFLDRDGLAVMEKAADIYETLYRGQQIDDNDIYIAAIAIMNDCVLVTDNEKHFGRVPGLKIVNWRE